MGANPPVFICAIRCEDGAGQRLSQTLLSLSQQGYPFWEAWVIGEHVSAPGWIADFPALKGIENHLTFPGRRELDARLAQSRGDWVVFAKAGDRFAPDALAQAARYLTTQPETDLLYSDADQWGDSGRRANPLLKPDWSPEFLLSCDYIGRGAFYRKDLLIRIGGVSSIPPEAFDYELALRFTETTGRIGHIAKILYSQGSNFPETKELERAALERAVRRRGLEANVNPIAAEAGLFTLEWLPTDLPLVSIILLTRDQPDFLRKSLTSIFLRTQNARFEVILVDNGSRQPETRRLIEHWRQTEPERFCCYPVDSPFNFSAINNRAAEKASGELLLFLNNDIEVISPDWIRQMAAQALQPGIGVVGPRLVYPDHTVQHAGVALDPDSAALHVHKGLAFDAAGYMGRLAVPSNFSAISAACMLVKKDLFLAQQGFDERFAVAFGDVEFCLRLLKAGYRHVMMPQIHLFHFKSATRGYENSPEKLQRFTREKEALYRLWPESFARDPFFDPRLQIKGKEVAWQINARERVNWTLDK